MITGWELVGTAPGAVAGPEGLPASGWRPALVPGTVAQAVGADLDAPGDLDGQDWWYRGTLRVAKAGARWRLAFEGLATLAEGWVGGVVVFTSQNAFLPGRCEVTLAAGDTPVVLCFRSVAAELARRRPRPRWKTGLVAHPNLRWLRTPLLGRIPGWTPRVPVIGPWRAIRLEPVLPVEVVALRLLPSASAGVARLVVEAELTGAVVEAVVSLGGRALRLTAVTTEGTTLLRGDFLLPDVPLWWPHTHGVPHRERCELAVRTAAGTVTVDGGHLGFRSIEVDPSPGGGGFRINGRPVFGRGACWSAENVRTIDGTPEVLAESLRLVVAAGANMLRVGGTMAWGAEAFYESCDRLGILVWQDLMFANMDYPFGDPEFSDSVAAELTAQVGRLSGRACVVAYCGGSEIEQQAAMLGFPREDWSGEFFRSTAPMLIGRLHPGVPWFPSTPTGGALPFYTGEGLAHYYGVGAYRRPLTDVRRARVRFAPECLAFANVPDAETMDAAFGATIAPHHPAWKAGVPRDSGAGWDFEDVRDHYLRELYGVDPVVLRSTDLDRYWALSRAVTGEVMARVYAEWRRPGSGCGGALVWFWKDLRPGAGWGLVDSSNRPKAAWWYLRRAWASRAVRITDEGLDGLGLHVLNDHADPFEGAVEIVLLQAGRRVVASACAPVALGPFSAETFAGDGLLGRFTDLTYAYRFGPPGHDVVVARLRDTSGATVQEDVYFPLGHGLVTVDAALLTASGEPTEGGVIVTLDSPVFVQTVVIAAPGYTPEDNYFHLTPGSPRHLRLRAGPGARAFRGWVTAANLEGGVAVRV